MIEEKSSLSTSGSHTCYTYLCTLMHTPHKPQAPNKQTNKSVMEILDSELECPLYWMLNQRDVFC